jgi:DNA-binding SARP family transcriptional activator
MLQLRLFGAPSLRDDDGEIHLASQKAQALLVYLAADAQRGFARCQLIALLWEESAEREGRNSLSTVLTRLRRALPSLPLRAEGDTLAWQPATDIWVDLHDAQQLLRYQSAADPAEPAEQTIQRLKAFTDLYRGPFLDGFSVRDSESYSEWLALERERWRMSWLDALAQLVEVYSITGEYAQALEYARRAAAASPLQERFHRALMRLYYVTGDRSAALTQYRLCRQLLERELGVEPDIATVQLHQAIVDGTLERTAQRSVSAAPPLASAIASPAANSRTRSLAPRLVGPCPEVLVGRAEALELFDNALAQPEPPFAVLHVTGPDGAGKSSLLRAFARQAAAAATLTLALDGRDIPPTPGGFLGALRRLTGAERPVDGLPDRIVLLIDTYECLAPIDAWLREQLLPQLPYWAIVVLADSTARTVDWRADLGWQAISRVVELGPLSDADSDAYLRQRAVPDDQHAAALRVAQGQPLALALAAETLLQQPASDLEDAGASKQISYLVERFLAGAPSDVHRAALEACAHVRVLSEPLLAALLGVADARALFVWLRQLAFVADGPGGIFMHDLVRAALVADLRQHNPRWSHELHVRARSFYLQASERDQSRAQDALLDLLFLHDDLLGQPPAATAIRLRQTVHQPSRALASGRRQPSPINASREACETLLASPRRGRGSWALRGPLPRKV